jgi:hypothetical protein
MNESLDTLIVDVVQKCETVLACNANGDVIACYPALAVAKDWWILGYEFFEKYGFNYVPISKYKQLARSEIDADAKAAAFYRKVDELFTMGGAIKRDY